MNCLDDSVETIIYIYSFGNFFKYPIGQKLSIVKCRVKRYIWLLVTEGQKQVNELAAVTSIVVKVYAAHLQ